MDGIERLNIMMKKDFNKPILKIFMYLKTRTDMDEKYKNPEKSLKQMYEYITQQARKQAINGVAMIEDKIVYSLAIHYFDESNESLGIVEKKKPEPKNQDKKEKVEDTNTSEVKQSKNESEKTSKENMQEREQITLF